MGRGQAIEYLQAMGIQAWSVRLHPPHWQAVAEDQAAPVAVAAAIPDFIPDTPPLTAEPPMTEAQMGKPDIVLAEPDMASSQPPALDEPPAINQGVATDGLGWDGLQARVAACTACALHQTRTQTVFGVGNRNADWLVIGEAPGEQEDLQGEPFVGRAGLLLNEMLRAIGLAREAVYIANILKCRPPKNRDPQADEAAACEGFLHRQMALVQPKIILAVGRIAAQNLLKTNTPIGKLRGAVHDYRGTPLVVTYHPAYLLRSPLEKRRAFDDLRLALHTYREPL